MFQGGDTLGTFCIVQNDIANRQSHSPIDPFVAANEQMIHQRQLKRDQSWGIQDPRVAYPKLKADLGQWFSKMRIAFVAEPRQFFVNRVCNRIPP